MVETKTSDSWRELQVITYRSLGPSSQFLDSPECSRGVVGCCAHQINCIGYVTLRRRTELVCRYLWLREGGLLVDFVWVPEMFSEHDNKHWI